MNKLLAYLACLCVGSMPFLGKLNAQNLKNKPQIVQPNHYKSNFSLFPLIYYSPETKIGLGVANIYLFKADSTTRTSSIESVVVFTQKKQIIVEPVWTIFTKKERYLIRGIAAYNKFPEFFYGIGANKTSTFKENIEYEYIKFNAQVLKKTLPKLFVGAQCQLYDTYNIHYQENSSIVPNSFFGYSSSFVSGLGLAMVYDSRDDINTPQKGIYAEFSNVVYGKYVGSQYQFNNYIVDLRHYKKITKQGVLATQLYANLNFGEVPFKQMGTFGGAFLMRGYYNGRFRNNHSLALQTEYRHSIANTRWGFTLFAGAADVSNKITNFRLSDVKLAAGAGIRFRLFKNDRASIRIDGGLGYKSKGFYANFTEAF